MSEVINEQGSELRDLIRLPVDILVQYKDGDKNVDEFCNNISIGGLFIETTNLLNFGTTLELKVTLPHNHLDLFIEGEVIWVQSKSRDDKMAGMGIKFQKLLEENKNALADAIEYYKFIKKKVS